MENCCISDWKEIGIGEIPEENWPIGGKISKREC
jgi:hypothetical protein